MEARAAPRERLWASVCRRGPAVTCQSLPWQRWGARRPAAPAFLNWRGPCAGRVVPPFPKTAVSATRAARQRLLPSGCRSRRRPRAPRGKSVRSSGGARPAASAAGGGANPAHAPPRRLPVDHDGGGHGRRASGAPPSVARGRRRHRPIDPHCWRRRGATPLCEEEVVGWRGRVVGGRHASAGKHPRSRQVAAQWDAGRPG